MIVVDTSALLAIVLDEPQAEACSKALRSQPIVFISAGTLAESLIVAGQRGVGTALAVILEGLACEVAPIDAVAARDVAEAYRRWGKGVHPARLNLADCFAYALAKARRAPLLYIGDDFRRTDIMSVLA